MREYNKIKNIWQRDRATGRLTPHLFTDPVFRDLWLSPWTATEKLDGTNIRIGLDEGNAFFVRGRTDRAQIPVQLYEHCLKLEEGVRSAFPSGGPVCLYGEGVGKGIQKDGHLYGDEQHFVLFDVLVCGRWWLKREDVRDVAEQADLHLVIDRGEDLSLRAAVALWLNKGQASWSYSGLAEGWVLRPARGLLFRDGTPIRVKLKERDFSQLREPDAPPVYPYYPTGVTWSENS